MYVKNIFDVSGKVILLTGAAGNLGTQYARGLTEAGADVVLADIDYSKCKKIQSSLEKKFKRKLMSVELDLRDRKSIIKNVKLIQKKFGKIDVLINNAAIQGNHKLRATKFENFPLSYWNDAVSVNLTGVFLMCQEVGKIMVKQKNGNIINISSTYGVIAPDQRIYGTSGQNSSAFYASTKSALINLTRYLASYWNRKGIRVNTLSPGGVENNQDPKFIKKYSEKTMIGRMAQKDEYVGALIFLCSDASSYMTGSNLIIDGGWTAW